LVCAALKALGNVVGDGERGTFELVAGRVTQPLRGAVDEIVNTVIESGGRLPDREILEALIGGHGGEGI